MPVTTKKTAATKSKATGNQILDTASMVENLTKNKALPMVENLMEDADFNWFQIGGVLAQIQEKDWWQDLGFETFKDFMEGRYGIKYRRGMHFISIYRNLTANEIPWDAVKSVGWSKLKEFADQLDPENVEEWVERANGMTVIQLQEYIKSLKAGTSKAGTEEGGEAETEVSDVTSFTTMTFKLHEDQKETIQQAIDKAKEENDTDSPAVALEYIAMQYIEGTLGKGKKATLGSVIEGKTIEEVLEAVEKSFPEANIQVEV